MPSARSMTSGSSSGHSECCVNGCHTAARSRATSPAASRPPVPLDRSWTEVNQELRRAGSRRGPADSGGEHPLGPRRRAHRPDSPTISTGCTPSSPTGRCSPTCRSPICCSACGSRTGRARRLRRVPRRGPGAAGDRADRVRRGHGRAPAAPLDDVDRGARGTHRPGGRPGVGARRAGARRGGPGAQRRARDRRRWPATPTCRRRVHRARSSWPTCVPPVTWSRWSAEGTFPFEAGFADSAEAPRVGDGMIRLDGDGVDHLRQPQRRLGLPPARTQRQPGGRAAGRGAPPAARRVDRPGYGRRGDPAGPAVSRGGAPPRLPRRRDRAGRRDRAAAGDPAHAGRRAGHARAGARRDRAAPPGSAAALQGRDDPGDPPPGEEQPADRRRAAAAAGAADASSPRRGMALRESVRRVTSIALVHETLSQSMGEEVDFDAVADQLRGDDRGRRRRPVHGASVDRQGSFGILPGTLATPLALVLSGAHAERGRARCGARDSARRSTAAASQLDLVVADDGARPTGRLPPRAGARARPADRAHARRRRDARNARAAPRCRTAAPRPRWRYRRSSGTSRLDRLRPLRSRSRVLRRIIRRSSSDLPPQTAGVLAGVERPRKTVIGHRTSATDGFCGVHLPQRWPDRPDGEEQLWVLVLAERAVAPVHPATPRRVVASPHSCEKIAGVKAGMSRTSRFRPLGSQPSGAECVDLEPLTSSRTLGNPLEGEFLTTRHERDPCHILLRADLVREGEADTYARSGTSRVADPGPENTARCRARCARCGSGGLGDRRAAQRRRRAGVRARSATRR